MDHGSVYRRCGCRDEVTRRLLGARCPGLNSGGHGSWYFSVDLPSAAGERRRVRRGGFATRAAAVAALKALASPAAGPQPGLSTGEWLDRCQQQRDVRRVVPLRLCRVLPERGGLNVQAKQRVHPVIRRQEDRVTRLRARRVLPSWEIIPARQDPSPNPCPYRVLGHPEHPPHSRLPSHRHPRQHGYLIGKSGDATRIIERMRAGESPVAIARETGALR